MPGGPQSPTARQGTAALQGSERLFKYGSLVQPVRLERMCKHRRARPELRCTVLTDASVETKTVTEVSVHPTKGDIPGRQDKAWDGTRGRWDDTVKGMLSRGIGQEEKEILHSQL